MTKTDELACYSCPGRKPSYLKIRLFTTTLAFNQPRLLSICIVMRGDCFWCRLCDVTEIVQVRQGYDQDPDISCCVWYYIRSFLVAFGDWRLVPSSCHTSIYCVCVKALSS